MTTKVIPSKRPTGSRVLSPRLRRDRGTEAKGSADVSDETRGKSEALAVWGELLRGELAPGRWNVFA